MAMAMEDLVKIRVCNADVPVPIAKFQTGLLEEDGDQVKFQMYRDMNPLRNNRLTLVGERDDNAYIGHNYGKDAPDSSRKVKYYVGIRKKNKMKIVPATMFSLKPKILIDEDNLNEDKEDDNMKMSFKETRNILVKSFGTQKKRKSLSAQSRDDVTAGAVDLAMTPVMKAVRDNPQVLKDDADDDTEDSGLSPPCNKDATEPRDVYDRNAIVTNEELDLLEELAEPLLKSTPQTLQDMKDDKKYSRYILSHFPAVLDREGEDLKKRMVCYLIYLNALIDLYNTPPRTVKKKILMNLPTDIREKILTQFTPRQSSARILPAKGKEKILAYILVLALILEDFTIRTNLFQLDLNLPSNKMQGVLSSLGCRIKTVKLESQGHCLEATLKVPLVLPQRSKFRRKRKFQT